MTIRVAVQGALGQMGREVMKAVAGAPDMTLVGGCDSRAERTRKIAPVDGSAEIPVDDDLGRLLNNTEPQVLVDFSLAAAVPHTAELAARAGVSLVIGTTGLSPQAMARLGDLAREHRVGVLLAPNFALGAVVMMELARTAARYFDWAEIIELHHEKKADAPSGTAIATARSMAANRDKPFQTLDSDASHPARGQKVEGVTVHSVRLPGLVANQEVILGAPGQTLSIKHDTTSRECFMPGVLLAVREIVGRPGEFVFGLEKLLNFQGG